MEEGVFCKVFSCGCGDAKCKDGYARARRETECEDSVSLMGADSLSTWDHRRFDSKGQCFQL